MKHFLPTLTLLIITSCRKTIDKAALPVQPEMVTVVEAEVNYSCCYYIPVSAEFPGGTEAWRRFIQQNLVYPAAAVDANIQGTVMVEFVVESDGTLSHIEAVSGPEELKESAAALMRKSPNWDPAIMNGRLVKDYHKQPIKFQLQEEGPE